ncbi:MAG: deoxyribose-phosphate aldolase [Planctomycetia bacterium]|nr:deoxyribose-phosphate aldolase [Planctomycetia bacterium]
MFAILSSPDALLMSIAKLIDHSLLHPTLTDAEIRAGCAVAREHGVASVCVKPYAVPLAAECLRGSTVAVGTVVGFPHGSPSTATKVFEAEQACRDGATELDMVINVGKALGGDWPYVEEDIRAVVAVAHRLGAITKVIFENDFLPNEAMKVKLCEICARVGAEYVKTSTGFGFVKQPDGHYNYVGATVDDVRLMREHSPPHVKVKAAGGVRNYADAARIRDAGAERIGATATVAIVREEREALR